MKMWGFTFAFIAGLVLVQCAWPMAWMVPRYDRQFWQGMLTVMLCGIGFIVSAVWFLVMISSDHKHWQFYLAHVAGVWVGCAWSTLLNVWSLGAFE